jgi:hypothetical protein
MNEKGAYKSTTDSIHMAVGSSVDFDLKLLSSSDPFLIF